HRRWYKIADVYLQAGQNQLVMRLTDEFIGTNVLFADAIMLLNSNRAGLPVVGIDEKDAGIPGEIELFQNYPNPFNPTTEIKFSLNSAANVRLSIFNILGQEIAVLANEKLPAGVYSRRWDARKFASGVYFYVLKSGNATQSKKMVLMR
ncbi:MAG: T9SS type A sorting domain-containing protein, partial [Calditrichaeota bacterium]|nr:T9SS type A sorting domain-containing protein [Calditrichota bacterium]